MHSGTAQAAACLYARFMSSEYVKATAAGLWVLAICIAGVASDATSVSHWILVAGVAIVPPVLVRTVWPTPAETLSQSIRRALR